MIPKKKKIPPKSQPTGDQHWISQYSAPTWKGMNMKKLEANSKLLYYHCIMRNEDIVIELSAIMWKHIPEYRSREKEKYSQLVHKKYVKTS